MHFTRPLEGLSHLGLNEVFSFMALNVIVEHDRLVNKNQENL